ncbi:putative cell cycle protein kinase [Nemania abortiva]|nr:putative cell cycle protein kinase [Nemania abortiva]
MTSKRSFHIHEDNLDVDPFSEEEQGREETEAARSQTESQSQTQRADDDYDEHEPDDEDAEREADDDDDQDGHDGHDRDEDASESSDEEDPIDTTVQQDMEKLQHSFPHFRDEYRLIKRIGEGTFSTVYKAEDIRYDCYVNSWDIDAEDGQWTPPPLRSSSASHPNPTSRHPRRRPKFVAIKKIYVTSSPARILNELELLHDLRDSPSVCPLITAFRESDQVLLILPYFRHQDFRKYYPRMNIYDTRVYLRSLFTALAAVHARGIIHRDIKPGNFLYDPEKKRGVLVDFGLAEREGTDTKPCLCHEDRQVRKHRLQQSVAFNSIHRGLQPGYPTQDTRPSRRANRAGTRGFRAPEVLFKCTEQTTKIDIWCAGVILLTILCKRFPFFNSADDIEAMIEIATIFGNKRMRLAGQLHGCMFDATIPTISNQGFSFEKIMLWSTCRSDGGRDGSANALTPEEKEAVEFLSRCMDLDPTRRISAEEALRHPFLIVDNEGEGDAEGDMERGLDAEEVMML